MADSMVRIQSDAWTEADERGYGEFIARLGDSGCRTVESCLNGAANPFRASNPPGFEFRSDCADLPYFCASIMPGSGGCPFPMSAMSRRAAHSRDIRYSPKGNQVEARRDVTTGDNALSVLNAIRDQISSATLSHPSRQRRQRPLFPRHRTPRHRPGTVIYDPNGHLAIVFRIEADGRIRYIDAHPDNSLTRGFYDQRFVRSSPGMGAGFKGLAPAAAGGSAAGGGRHLGGRACRAGAQRRDPRLCPGPSFSAPKDAPTTTATGSAATLS